MDLRQVTMPALSILAEGKVIVPPPCSRGFTSRLGSRDVQELAVPGGHIGVFVGGKAQHISAPR